MRIAYWEWYSLKNKIFTNPTIVEDDKLLNEKDRILTSDEYVSTSYKKCDFDLQFLSLGEFDVIKEIIISHENLKNVKLDVNVGKDTYTIFESSKKIVSIKFPLPVCAIRSGVFTLRVEHECEITFPSVNIIGYTYVNDYDYYRASVSSYVLPFDMPEFLKNMSEFSYHKNKINIHISEGVVVTI